MKKIIVYITLVCLLFCKVSTQSYASGTNNTFYETTVGNVLGYTCDDNNLPTTGNYYFGLTNDGYVYYVAMSRALPLILNKGIGVVLSPSVMVDFVADYISTGIVDDPFKPVYSGSTIIGRSFENLIGKTLLGSNNTTDYQLTIPREEVNNVYNFYNQWKADEGYDLPDYITFETRNRDFFKNKLNTQDTYYQASINYLNNENNGLTLFGYTPSNLTYYLLRATTSCIVESMDDVIMYSPWKQNYDDYVNAMHLTASNNTVSFTDQLLKSGPLRVTISSLDNLSGHVDYKSINTQTDGTYPFGSNGTIFEFGSSIRLPCSETPYLTVYKNSTVMNQIVNKTYAPVSFNSQQYYDYSEQNDNSIQTTSSTVDNSSTTNETIYNESAESFTEYYEENNYHIDNSVTISNTTEIVNNYYGNGSDDGGGGSGGNDNDGDDDNNGVLDKLLSAILGFFDAIGKILITLLTGIVELFTKIIEAIGNITESFDVITDFLSSIFGWLPAEVVAIMVLGIGLALLGAFLTWFK